MSSVPNPGDALAVEADPLAAPVDVAAPVEGGHTWAADAQPKLVVTRGLKQNVEYPLYPGQNFLGRADDKPVDVDLDDQEPPDRVWSSRQHALIIFENGQLTLEDLNSANGTFLNRAKVVPGQKQCLKPDDVIQVGTVQLKVKA
ncbi:MAG: FHA domain-containing protein [Planctomycetia bacterium]|nr:FHA domain-containing protein [Planctomycetia bacterium]